VDKGARNPYLLGQKVWIDALQEAVGHDLQQLRLFL
jgi:hypothetical protein